MIVSLEYIVDNTDFLRQAALVDEKCFIARTPDAAGQSVVFAISYRPAKTVHTKKTQQDTKGNIFK